MAEEPPTKKGLGWLALADCYVAEAIEAEQSAQRDSEPSLTRQPRTTRAAAHKLTFAKRHVSTAKARVARQEAVVSKLAQSGRDAAKARRLLCLMRHVLDLRRQRLQALLDHSSTRKPARSGRMQPGGGVP